MGRALLLAAGALLLGGGAWWLTRRDAPAEAEQDAGAWNLANLTEEASNIVQDQTDPDQAERNVAAFLMVIRHAEGTAGANGYRLMFGGRYFDSFADHPRDPMQFKNGNGQLLWSSAAGAYQFMAISPLPGGGSTRVDTWDRLARQLALPDFSPASQDAGAVELIDQAGALADVRAGRFADAVAKCRRTWASLPGAGYAQPERSLAWLETKFVQEGGVTA